MLTLVSLLCAAALCACSAGADGAADPPDANNSEFTLKQARCGTSADNAAATCGASCYFGEACPAGQNCYRDLLTSCVSAVPGPVALGEMSGEYDDAASGPEPAGDYFDGLGGNDVGQEDDSGNDGDAESANAEISAARAPNLPRRLRLPDPQRLRRARGRATCPDPMPGEFPVGIDRLGRGVDIFTVNPLATGLDTFEGFKATAVLDVGLFVDSPGCLGFAVDGYATPTGANVLRLSLFSNIFISVVIETAEEYVDKLETAFSGDATLMAFGGKGRFRASSNYKRAIEELTGRKNSITSALLEAAVYQADLDPGPQLFNQDFTNALVQLPTAFSSNKQGYFSLLRNYGTHVIASSKMGARHGSEVTTTQESNNVFKSEGLDIEKLVEAEAEVVFFGGKSQFTGSTQELLERRSKLTSETMKILQYTQGDGIGPDDWDRESVARRAHPISMGFQSLDSVIETEEYQAPSSVKDRAPAIAAAIAEYCTAPPSQGGLGESAEACAGILPVDNTVINLRYEVTLQAVLVVATDGDGNSVEEWRMTIQSWVTAGGAPERENTPAIPRNFDVSDELEGGVDTPVRFAIDGFPAQQLPQFSGTIGCAVSTDQLRVKASGIEDDEGFFTAIGVGENDDLPELEHTWRFLQDGRLQFADGQPLPAFATPADIGDSALFFDISPTVDDRQYELEYKITRLPDGVPNSGC